MLGHGLGARHRGTRRRSAFPSFGGLGASRTTLDDDARALLVEHAQGDARSALGTLEVAAGLAMRTGQGRITPEIVA